MAVLTLLGVPSGTELVTEQMASDPPAAAAPGTGAEHGERAAFPLPAAPQQPTRSASQQPAPQPSGSAAAAVAAGVAAGAEAGLDEDGIAVAVLDRTTGEYAGNAAAVEQRYTASLSKIIVIADILAQAEGEPDDRTRELIRRALGPSDDEAMNVLWTLYDGPAAVEDTARATGLGQTAPPNDPSQWGETVTSARDIAALYTHVLDELPARDRDLIIGSLAAAPTTAADGFDQGFGLLSPALPASVQSDIAAKQGWMCCHGGEITLHSAGVAGWDGQDGEYVIVLLSRQPAERGYGAARDTLDKVAHAVLSTLTRSM